MAIAAALALMLFSGDLRAFAQNRVSGSDKTGQKEKIQIVADMLTSDSGTHVAEFSGNVRATQGETVITSDRLKIVYSEKLAASKNPSAGEGAIETIIATGNVRISFDNRVATAQEAVYNTESKVLVLSGAHSKITSGADSITGEKITYNRNDGHITVESGRNSRVEAVFHTQSDGIR
ncbi:MAG: lipopolysaccharide transport periplasmic protein LptA [Thermodesulfobacteriota bacterium]